jgi:hypothetical protein
MRKSVKILYIMVFQLILLSKIICQNTDKNVKDAQPKETKFLHVTELGFLLGSQSPINNIYPAIDYGNAVDARLAYYYPYYQGDTYNNFTFQHFSGYKVHKAIALGVTGSFDYYRANIITPLSLGVRSTLIPSRRISPIANVDFGYGFIWRNYADKQNKIDKDGGLMFNPSVGIRIKVGNEGSQMNVNIGYKLQQSKMTSNRPADQYYLTEYHSFNRLSVRLGLGF